MDAKTFYSKFKDAITETDYWKELYYGKSPEFTKSVTKEINQIIESYPDYKVQNEYYRIDAIGWKHQNDEAKSEAIDVELNWHQWDLKIAVEHENDLADWTDELTKLIHIRCPLKVIIGYNHWDCREELEQKKLAYAAKWMQHIKAFDPDAKEEYLIILGNTYSKNNKVKSTNFDYRGYLYDYETAQFIQLKDEAQK